MLQISPKSPVGFKMSDPLVIYFLIFQANPDIIIVVICNVTVNFTAASSTISCLFSPMSSPMSAAISKNVYIPATSVIIGGVLTTPATPQPFSHPDVLRHSVGPGMSYLWTVITNGRHYVLSQWTNEHLDQMENITLQNLIQPLLDHSAS